MWSNEILTIAEIFVNFLVVMIVYRFFGKTGLIVWVVVAVITANIQVGILIHDFGMASALGNVVYASTYLAIDIINENYDQGTARRAVLISFVMLTVFVLTMNMCFLYSPENDISAYAQVFQPMLRFLAASLLAFFVSENLDIVIYSFFKKKNSGTKYIWFRCNISSIFSEMIDTAIFSLVAFWGVLPLKTIFFISISSYVIKVAASICDTPLVYIAKYWKQRGIVADAE